MKKIIFIFLFAYMHLNAASQEQIWNWFEDKQYDKVCSNSVTSSEYYKYKNDEDFVNAYAFSCLQTDMINRLSMPIIQLRKSKNSRANALYYSTVIYQKKILQYALADGFTNLPKDLPSTEYILSKIYDRFVNHDYEQQDNVYIFKEQNSNISYKLFSKKFNDGFTKIVLQTLNNNEIIKTRLYW